MTKAELMLYVGKKVHIYFKGGEKGIYGTLGYVDEFSAKHEYRKINYFYIGNTSFKVSHIRKVKEGRTIMELISREEVLKLKQTPGAYGMNISSKEVEQLPIIESRPKGKFEYLGESKRATYVDMYKCSNCDFVSLSLGDDFLNYCPNCGADMRG